MMSALRWRLQSWTGLDFGRAALYSALERYVQHRADRLGISEDALVRSMYDVRCDEVRRLLEEITIGHSWFFRDVEQWHALTTLIARMAKRRLSCWVPACAAGEDAYSLAIIGSRAGRDLQILATDISERRLEAARRACYGEWAVREAADLLGELVRRQGDGWCVAPSLRSTVRFAWHNLLDPPPERQLDLVVCRNVLIYFDRAAASRVVENIAAAMTPGGYLLLGASDLNFDPPKTLRTERLGVRWVLRRVTPQSLPPQASPPAPALRRSVQSDPLDGSVELARGTELYRAALYSEALHALRAAVCLNPHAWAAAFQLGLCYERLGFLPEARQAFLQAATNGTGNEAKTARDHAGRIARSLHLMKMC